LGSLHRHILQIELWFVIRTKGVLRGVFNFTNGFLVCKYLFVLPVIDWFCSDLRTRDNIA